MVAHDQCNATLFPFSFLFKGILPVDFEILLHFFLDKRLSVTTSIYRFGSFHLMYLLAINQALPYGCSFVTYGHPGGSEAGDIIIIWNDVLK